MPYLNLTLIKESKEKLRNPKKLNKQTKDNNINRRVRNSVKVRDFLTAAE
jgi:hypothetical protein